MGALAELLAQLDALLSAGPSMPTHSNVVCGRLTADPATPLTTSDLASVTHVHWVPCNGNAIALIKSGVWTIHNLEGLDIDLAGLPANKNVDVFGYSDAGLLQVELVQWTDDANRSAAITSIDGVDVKAGDYTRRLIGTIRTKLAGTTEDSAACRFISNRYNAEARPLAVADSSTSWAWSSPTWRQARAAATNQVEFVSCVQHLVEAEALGLASSNTPTNVNCAIGIGINSSSQDASDFQMAGNCNNGLGTILTAGLRKYLPPGYASLKWLEYGSGYGGSVQTFFGSGVIPIIKPGLCAVVLG